MNHSKEGALNQLGCKICEIDYMSNAEYALHEFTKKHCDNLIRLSKNKPILKKQKSTSKILEVEKEAVNTDTYTGSIAKYGYFIPGEIYKVGEDPKEFNQDYDPYLQKFAESSYNEKAKHVEELQKQCTMALPFPAKGSKKSKKKKSRIKICQVCNLMFVTTSIYEAHMKSLDHMLKLKASGMGLSAHFVKASSDLQTIETKEDQKVDQGLASVDEMSSHQDFSTDLHSNTGEVELNSSFQCTTLVPEKNRVNFFNKESEGKEVLENSPSDKVYCYTCNILLNTALQFNQHKQGKKHKIKCRLLIKQGMTVPPEERVPGIDIPANYPGQPVYPQLYEKMILQKQNKSVFPTPKLDTGPSKGSSVLELPVETNPCDQNVRLNNFNQKSGDNRVCTGIQDSINFTTTDLENASNQELVKESNTTSYEINFVPVETNEKPNSEDSSSFSEVSCTGRIAESGIVKQYPESNIVVLNNEEYLHCSICDENFLWQFQFDLHLSMEEHLKKIVELKVFGKNDNEILTSIFADRNVVKPDNLGRITCSICKVTADSKAEFGQHLNCVAHKCAEKDYKERKTFEVSHLIPPNEGGIFYCKLCKLKLTSLIEFIQHFFNVKHKNIQNRKGKFKKVALFQRQRPSQSMKKKCITLQPSKADENSKEREIYGSGTDLQTGSQSEIPDLKRLEPKIELMKNADIELSKNSDSFEAKTELGKLKFRKRQNLFGRGSRIPHYSLKHSNSDPCLPLLLSDNFIPSTSFSRFPNRRRFGRHHSSVKLHNFHPYDFA